MFCDYCRRLFEFRQKVERYNPPQKGLGGISATSSASWLQPTRRLEQEEREWREETEKGRGKRRKLEARPKLEIYEDAEDLFTPRLLWWKVPIGRNGCELKDSHVLNTECQTCKMIFSNVSASLIEVLLKKTNQENNSIAFVYQLKSTTNPVRKRLGIANNEAILSVWLEVGQDLLPMVKLQVKKKLDTPLRLTYSHVEPTNTGSIETLALAASWIRNCDIKHPGCGLSRNSGRRLPTRLINVGTRDGTQKPHLWIPEHPSETVVQYVALSYRWNKSPGVILTKASLASLCEEIPLDLLPQSNQDAIRITRHFGIKYIWIDALCILQDLDDVSDWLRESSRMGDIYKFAYLTISASQASTGKEGCFAERQPLEARFVQSCSTTRTTSTYRQPKVHPDIVIRTLQTDLWATEVDASPLSRRAWTLQERLLSTRVLHFTRGQLFWECQLGKACETSPYLELKSPHDPPDEIISEASRSVRQLDGVALTPLEDHWEELVEIYTDAHLTRPEDKLVAISSLAKEVQQRTKDHYYAGLWCNSFARDLLYRLEIPQQPPSFNYRAPSWSWASVTGKVNFICKRQNHASPASTIQSIWTLGSDGKRGSIGQIKDASFDISAPTAEILRYEKWGNIYRLVLTEEPSDSIEFFPDTMTKIFPKDAICLPILYYSEARMGSENKSLSFLAGLVVHPTGDFRDEYCRLGVFRMSERSGKEWFEGLEWKSLSVI